MFLGFIHELVALSDGHGVTTEQDDRMKGGLLCPRRFCGMYNVRKLLVWPWMNRDNPHTTGRCASLVNSASSASGL
jgi:hypothetical protein